MTIAHELTNSQIALLQPVADRCFAECYYTTEFARTVDVALLHLGVEISSPDDYYDMRSEGNAPMRSALRQIGYGISAQGWGIYKIADLPVVNPMPILD